MPDDIHIAALVPYPVFPARMGGQKGIALFYTFLSRIARVTVFGTRDNEIPASFNGSFIPILSESRSRYYNFSLVNKLSSLIREKKITHLIAEHPYYAWLVLLLKRYTGVKLIVHSHNIESLRFRDTGKWWWGILWHYEKLLHRKADLNFFISDEDRELAIKKFDLNPARCETITYGFDLLHPPSSEERERCRKILEQLYGISNDEKILFFNGTLSYGPNLDALRYILDKINPLLVQNGFRYKILVAGKGLPPAFNELKEFRQSNIVYAGFVEDISILFKGSGIFLNPVNGGGGIKTKLVEALGSGLTCVSTRTGAIGVPQHITGTKMIIVEDDDYAGFAGAVINANISDTIPQAFFDHFAWENIVQKALNSINKFAE